MRKCKYILFFLLFAFMIVPKNVFAIGFYYSCSSSGATFSLNKDESYCTGGSGSNQYGIFWDNANSKMTIKNMSTANNNGITWFQFRDVGNKHITIELVGHNDLDVSRTNFSWNSSDPASRAFSLDNGNVTITSDGTGTLTLTGNKSVESIFDTSSLTINNAAVTISGNAPVAIFDSNVTLNGSSSLNINTNTPKVFNGNSNLVLNNTGSVSIANTNYPVFENGTYTFGNTYTADNYIVTNNTSTGNFTSQFAYNLIFNTNGGSLINLQKIAVGSAGSRPENPIKIGYTFDNWYSDEELENLYDFSTVLTSNNTIYAKWNKNVYHFLDGENEKIVIGTDNGYDVRIDTDLDDFIAAGAVYVDGKLVSASNYTLESGSTIIKFKDSFIKSLSIGNHSLKINLGNEEILSTTFTTVNSVANVNTSDNIMIYIVLFIISGISISTITCKFRKVN